MPIGVLHCLRAIPDPGLGEQPIDVRLHGRLGEEQPGRDLAIGQAGSDQLEDVYLAGREPVGWRIRLRDRRVAGTQ